MELSIIIVNWNTKEYLRRCLNSIEHLRMNLSYEVIVVDNASGDGSASLVREDYPQVKLIANNSNQGFARGNNQGLRIAKGKFIVILNPDTVIQHGVFERMIAYLKEDPQVGAVGCKLLNADGSFQRGFYRRFPTLPIVFFCITKAGRFIDRWFLKRKHERNYFYRDRSFSAVEKIDQISGTFMFIPRAVIERIGLFDEALSIFFNDVDFCKRIWLGGYEIHALPDVTITHYGGSSISKIKWGIGYLYLYIGCYRYFRRHHGIFPALIVNIMLLLNGFILFMMTPIFIWRSYIRSRHS